jgi:hypothetical protein
MRYLRLFGVALVALCALGSVIAVSASALPTILPTTITAFTGKSSGKTKLERQGGLAAVECEKAKGEGTVEANGHLGLYHITFETCTAAGGQCTGLGDTAGNILSLGSYHLVFDTLKATLAEAGVAILFLVDNVHFICKVPILGEILQEVFLGGMVLCLVANPTALTKVFEFQCKEGASDHPLLSKYYNEAGTLVKISPLMSSEGEGTEAEGAQIGNATTEYVEAALLML